MHKGKNIMEKQIEKYLRIEIERLGGLCVKFPPLFFRGFPDRIVLLPGALIVFVEMKDKGKKPTGMQMKIHDKLRALGFRVEVLDSKESVDCFIMAL